VHAVDREIHLFALDVVGVRPGLLAQFLDIGVAERALDRQTAPTAELAVDVGVGDRIGGDGQVTEPTLGVWFGLRSSAGRLSVHCQSGW